MVVVNINFHWLFNFKCLKCGTLIKQVAWQIQYVNKKKKTNIVSAAKVQLKKRSSLFLRYPTRARCRRLLSAYLKFKCHVCIIFCNFIKPNLQNIHLLVLNALSMLIVLSHVFQQWNLPLCFVEIWQWKWSG